jgi:16S rRNA (uracil1498-N3)-methyltransferase
MSAPQFFVDHLPSGGHVQLSEDDSRHALRSLRLHPGDEVALADGRGLVSRGVLVEEQEGRAIIAVGPVSNAVLETPVLSVAIAPPKGDRLAWAAQKLAELGVEELVLLETERSVRSWPGQRAERAVERLRSIVREASMQSRQPKITEVWGPFGLPRILQGDPMVVMLEAGAKPLGTVLPKNPVAIRLLVGPEGGFAEHEVEAARRSGATVASLGRGILRTETAAVVASALVLARYGRLG